MSLADAQSPPIIGIAASGYTLLIAFPLVYSFSGIIPGFSTAVLLPLTASGTTSPQAEGLMRCVRCLIQHAGAGGGHYQQPAHQKPITTKPANLILGGVGAWGGKGIFLFFVK